MGQFSMEISRHAGSVLSGNQQITTQTDRIRELNDVLRTTWLTGTVLMTSGIKNLPDAIQSGIVEAVQRFNAFTPDNGLHGEHDFGAVAIEGHRFFWKIDYYDRTMQYGSEDPANPAVTKRVLTIMLVEEY